MGIVAYCPQGHRVKVKDQLAGKKGLCPVCGTKFRIPAAHEAAAPVASVPPAAAPGRDVAATALPSARILTLDPAVVATLPRAIAWDVAAETPLRAPPLPAAASETVSPPARLLHPVLAERQDIAWSIALPGGAASPPLTPEQVQDWLDAGQATGDEVVWRADWPQWLPARQVFPEAFA